MGDGGAGSWAAQGSWSLHRLEEALAAARAEIASAGRVDWTGSAAEAFTGALAELDAATAGLGVALDEAARAVRHHLRSADLAAPVRTAGLPVPR